MRKQQPTTGAGGLSQLELGLIADALATGAAEFAEHSNNDFSFPAIAAHRAIGAAIVRHREGQGRDAEGAPAVIAEMKAAKKKIVLPDFWAADYFAGVERRDPDPARASSYVSALANIV